MLMSLRATSVWEQVQMYLGLLELDMGDAHINTHTTRLHTTPVGVVHSAHLTHIFKCPVGPIHSVSFRIKTLFRGHVVVPNADDQTMISRFSMKTNRRMQKKLDRKYIYSAKMSTLKTG